MFEAFFSFTGTPFSRDIAVNNLLSTDNWQEMGERLKYVARTRCFGVFTGDAGTGKTTAIRKLCQELDKAKFRILYISDSAMTPRTFYGEALNQVGIEPRFYRGDSKRLLQKALADLVDEEKKTPVIIVDEAHLLKREMLEEIRFLLNLRMDSYSALSLILAGQSELKDTLRLQVNDAISQRVDMRFHLHPLNSQQTAQYIKKHLESVRAAGEIFTNAAVGVIHEYCGGIPRKINKVSIACLMAASCGNSTLVDDYLVRTVIENEFEG
jgi:general secretion pathway protein A